MNNLQIFKSPEFGQVRVLEKDGQPWFIAKDVSTILEYTDAEAMCRRLDDDEQTLATSQNLQNVGFEIPTRGLKIINESGFYSAVLGSKKPEAKKFKKWVTSEVLPQIRQTGGYIPTGENDSEEDILAKAVLIAQKTIEKKNQIIAEKDKQLEDQKPKVIFADALEVSENSILIGELAKILRQNGIDIGQNRLFEWLRQEGYLIKKKGESYNQPTQYGMDLGLFQIKKRTINNPDGSVRATTTTKVTGKGQIYFVNKFKEAV